MGHKVIEFLLVFVCIISVTFSACSNSKQTGEEGSNQIADVIIHEKLSEQVIIGNLPLENMGRGVGFVRQEDVHLYQFERPSISEFQIDEGDSFTPYLILINGTDIERTYLITTILDYEQVDFELDGKTGLLHEITVPPDTELNIPFTLDIHKPGAHDVLVIGFDYPYNVSLDTDYRMDLYGYLATFRTVVIVDGQDIPVQSIQYTVKGNLIPEDVHFTYPLYFADTTSSEDIHPSKRQMYITTAQPNNKFAFQIVVNNNEEEMVNYMLVAFLDYHQIDIAGQRSTAISLASKEEAVLDVQISIPSEPKIYQFQMIRLFDPFCSLIKDEAYSNMVFGSPRIAIDSR